MDLTTAIATHFEQRFAEDVGNNQTASIYDYVYFITFTFDDRTAFTPDALMSQVKEFYFTIHKYMCGKRLDRSHRNQTLTYAFLDFEGSRFPKSMIIDPRRSTYPHVHCVTYVPPQHRQLFESYVAGFSHRKEILVVKADPSLGTLQHLIDYCAKGYTYTSKRDALTEDLWTVIPERQYTNRKPRKRRQRSITSRSQTQQAAETSQESDDWVNYVVSKLQSQK